MPQLLRPRTQRQRQASIGLVNIVFLTLVTWLLSGALPPGLDHQPTSSLALDQRAR